MENKSFVRKQPHLTKLSARTSQNTFLNRDMPWSVLLFYLKFYFLLSAIHSSFLSCLVSFFLSSSHCACPSALCVLDKSGIEVGCMPLGTFLSSLLRWNFLQIFCHLLPLMDKFTVKPTEVSFSFSSEANLFQI